MLNINCSTCLELLTPSAELSSAPCGHVFHAECIARWLSTSGKSTCPQCRAKCREGQLRRIYFTEGLDASLSQSDAGDLRNKLDSLTFNLRCAETERKRAQEERDDLSAKNVALRDEFRAAERRAQTARDEAAQARAQLRMMQAERLERDKARREADELREKLALYENIDAFVKGSVAEVNDRLHEIRDFSKASQELSIIIQGLKMKMMDQKAERTQLLADKRELTRRLVELKTKFVEQTRLVNELQRSSRALAEDARHAEDERASLKAKLARLQEALEDGSGSGSGSGALKRMAVESPAPKRAATDDETTNATPRKKCDLPQDEMTPPMFRPRQCSIVGLNRQLSSAPKLRSPCKDTTNSDQIHGFNIMKKSRLTSGLAFSQPTSASSSSSASSEQFYNGLGGHSKLDSFPDPLHRPRVAAPPGKKPKGVSRPKSRPVGGPVKKVNTLNKFFNLDTP